MLQLVEARRGRVLALSDLVVREGVTPATSEKTTARRQPPKRKCARGSGRTGRGLTCFGRCVVRLKLKLKRRATNAIVSISGGDQPASRRAGRSAGPNERAAAARAGAKARRGRRRQHKGLRERPAQRGEDAAGHVRGRPGGHGRLQRLCTCVESFSLHLLQR
jgi:hypothetical protein